MIKHLRMVIVVIIVFISGAVSAETVYYPLEDDTLVHMFATFDGGTGSSMTMTNLVVADIKIYKDGAVAEREGGDSGIALIDDGMDFDGMIGIHAFSIDLSDDADTDFYEVGSWYHVVIDSVTIDEQTVRFVACSFRILDASGKILFQG